MANSGNELGETLSWLMKRAGLRNADIARSVHVDPTQVSKWRSGVNKPDTAKLQILVDLFRLNGVETSIEEMRKGPGQNGAGRVSERTRPFVYGQVAEVEFGSTTAKQRALLRVQELLVEFAEAGADDEFVTWARQFLLNPDNFVHSVGGAAGKSFDMSDEDKVRHLETLALVPRGILAHRNKKGRK